MDFRDLSELSKQNKTSEAILRHLSERVRAPKRGIIDLAHFRRGVRKTSGFSYDDYTAFWKDLAKRGFGKYRPATRDDAHDTFEPSENIIEFAKMATGQIPTTIEQEQYNQENPASAHVEGPVFQIATLIVKNLPRMSRKEVEFISNLLTNGSGLL